MISGPVPPHPRILLADLLEDGESFRRLGALVARADASSEGGAFATPSPGDLLEAGLDLFEVDVRLGDELEIDFLGCDAAGAPVAVLAVAEDDCRDLPLQLLDVDLWFRENAFLMRRGLGLLEGAWTRLRWDLPHRLLLVTAQGLDPRTYRRLEGLAALPLTVRELRSVLVRGERHWYTRGVAPWSEDLDVVRDASAPSVLHDAGRAELVHDLLARLPSLGARLEVLGDACHRQVLCSGDPVLRIVCTDDEVRCWLPDEDEGFALNHRRDVDRALDRLLRALIQRDGGLALPAPANDATPANGAAPAHGGTPTNGVTSAAPAAASAPAAGEPTRTEPAATAEPAPAAPARANGQRAAPTPGVQVAQRLRRARVAYATGILGPATRPKLPPLPAAEDLGPKLSDEEIDAFLDS
ncbi:MAG: hypothetical protein R3F30_12310 [Planctomycetota bacterium]